MLPVVDQEIGEISCIMEHINTGIGEEKGNREEYQSGVFGTSSMSQVVWSSAKNGILARPERPVVVVISAHSDSLSLRIQAHYKSANSERWLRLEANQTWLYLDLYFLFTRWDRVWAAVKQNLRTRSKEVQRRSPTLSILEQTRQLHDDNTSMIGLREHLRVHIASLKAVIRQSSESSQTPNWQKSKGLVNRLDEAFQLLEYYDMAATSLLEQQQNLLSLAFSMETVFQGKAVARLNALAFIFLPPSFVASIFGITTMTISPKWYPLAATATLLTTLVIALLISRFGNVSGDENAKNREATPSFEKTEGTGNTHTAFQLVNNASMSASFGVETPNFQAWKTPSRFWSSWTPKRFDRIHLPDAVGAQPAFIAPSPPGTHQLPPQSQGSTNAAEAGLNDPSRLSALGRSSPYAGDLSTLAQRQRSPAPTDPKL